MTVQLRCSANHTKAAVVPANTLTTPAGVRRLCSARCKCGRGFIAVTPVEDAPLAR